MDEALEKKILPIVADMKSQGLSRAEIEATLTQMGIDSSGITELLAKAGLEVKHEDIQREVVKTKEMLERAEHLQPAMKKIGEQAVGIERLHTQVGELHDKSDALLGSSEDIRKLHSDVKELHSDVRELHALLSAIKTINKKMLELNNRILTELATR